MSPKKKNVSTDPEAIASQKFAVAVGDNVAAETPTNPPDVDGETPQAESLPFVGQWNRLISTTNWEKGRIIVAWRQDLAARGLAPTAYSDEAWSRLVGGVSPQHVGRLRRTYERFGEVYSTYPHTYWSHFYAALDWHDAEMWLEGAVQNRWSVSQMRQRRWEATGRDPHERPVGADIVATEIDEELSSLALAERGEAAAVPQDFSDYVPGPRDERPDFGDELDISGNGESERVTVVNENRSVGIPLFAAFDSLPEDVSEAAEDFKLCIIRHKADGWRDISSEQMLALLDALKQLALTD